MYSWDNAQVVLVGNKCDLEQDRAVTQERGQRLADQLGKVFHFLLDVRFNRLFIWVNICLYCVVFFKGFYR
jgi:GTPase SAR1 family protein